MPYIAEAIKDTIELPYVADDGQLTFVIDALAESLLAAKCSYDWANLKYPMISQVVGDIECAKSEFMRRILNVFEDRKMVENGDCFEAPAFLGRELGEAIERRAS